MLFQARILTPNVTSFKKGFTLIELLIVIAIIGILTTLLTANFVGVRQRARDTQRKSDIRQIQSALELFRSDNARYPVRTVTYRINSGTVCMTSEAFTYNSVTYMSKVPCDPSGTTGYNSGNYYYVSDASGLTYTLATCLENANDKDTYSTSSAPSPSGGTCSSGKYYVVNNP
ncbi:MAG: type II secretion system protein [Candidatus Levybacteria bacterium]|nr:type II secretion system protein [Candidatus Levybacteria bacterium]